MAECKDCIHIEVCAYVSHDLPICDSFTDAAPVRYGSWVNAYISGIHHYRCTECGEYIEATWTANFEYNFCPNCGARMDKED